MNLANINKRLITLSSICILFVGSLFYLVSIAFQTSETLSARQVDRQEVDNYFKE